MASDLRCISDMNLLFKYADDINLLVAENTNVDLANEFSNIQEWADQGRRSHRSWGVMTPPLFEAKGDGGHNLGIIH